MERKLDKNEAEKNSEVNETKYSNKMTRKIRETFERISGFQCEDLTSFERFASAMYKPTDPASLGVVRALFGLCMVVDVMEERGLSTIDLKWGDPNVCHFPLIHGMRPPSLAWMVVLYALMWLGAFGIMLGLHFRWACGLFALPYWYIHLLDKSYWNNHSYLFGIVALLLWGTGANRYFALDAKLAKEKEEDGEKKSLPYWNYFILKFQFFLLYFMAGLKKSSQEWLEGYAMSRLSSHWVFEPFKLFLSEEQTDYYIVHWFAFIFDLSVGFFMLLEPTRLPAMLLCTLFHLMNSRLFSIGMFPFVCLGTMPLFCRADWPRKLAGRWARLEKSPKEADSTATAERNKAQAAAREVPVDRRSAAATTRASRKQRLLTAALLLHIGLQLFLPYSHFITKGYNNWVPGLYGYSWDMMMHAWDTILTVVKVRDNETGKDYFLDPDVWVPNNRWSRHGDMVRQYAYCVKDNLERLKNRSGPQAPWQNISSNISVYVDVWCSLNGRFQQRLFNPNVDMLQADWHPFKPISYLMPLLQQFSSYRSELERIQAEVVSWSNETDVLFVAEHPGQTLENYVSPELGNVTLRVLEGEVIYQARPERAGTGRTIGKGGTVRVRAGRFHRVETASPHPACYAYTFANRTKRQLAEHGIVEPPRIKEAFPILKEIGYRIDAFGRALGHIANAFFHLTLDVPMIRRISLDSIGVKIK